MYSLRIGKNARNTLFSVCVCVRSVFVAKQYVAHTFIFCRSKDNANFFDAKKQSSTRIQKRANCHAVCK